VCGRPDAAVAAETHRSISRQRLSLPTVRPSVRPSNCDSAQDLYYFIIVLSIGECAGGSRLFDERPIGSANRNYIFSAPRPTTTVLLHAGCRSRRRRLNVLVWRRSAVRRRPRRTIKWLTMSDERHPPSGFYTSLWANIELAGITRERERERERCGGLLRPRCDGAPL